MTDKTIPVTPNTQAQKVREELVRFTGRGEWSRDEYWQFYLKKRKEIFDVIHRELDDKNWLNPLISQRIEQQYITRAKQLWSTSGDHWALEGGWLDCRPDIVSWMRSTFWKHNQRRLTQTPSLQGSSEASVFFLPATGDGKTVGGEGGKSWKEIVLH